MLEVLPEELEPGAVIAGKYRLEREVGRGGMGVVWSCTHTVTGKAFALKFLSAARAAEPKSHERMVREARAACTVRHPNVAEILDVLELDSGVPFLVMDLLEGESLAGRLAREKTLSPSALRAIFLPVIDAVSAAHQAGVVHRDLKPENVFLTTSHQGVSGVKVVDFGVAKLGSFTDAPSNTTTGELVGTPIYMAPEQVFADRDIDGRADVWALGVLLYESLAGKPPTAGETVGQVLKAITREPLVPLEDLVPDAPTGLSDVVMRMLSKDRDGRPSLDEVRRVLEGEPSTTMAVATSQTSPASRKPLSSFAIVATVAAVLLVLVGVGRYAARARGSEASTGTTSSAASTVLPVVSSPSSSALAAQAAQVAAASTPAIAPEPTKVQVGSVAARPTSMAGVAAPASASPEAKPSPAPSGSGGAWHGSGIVLSHDRK